MPDLSNGVSRLVESAPTDALSKSGFVGVQALGSSVAAFDYLNRLG